jgi:hypothetical protein
MQLDVLVGNMQSYIYVVPSMFGEDRRLIQSGSERGGVYLDAAWQYDG